MQDDADTATAALAALAPLVGEWTVAARFPNQALGEVPGATTVFEWLPGERFLVQRWEVPVPEAPDGIAVIGFDEERGSLLQHYFDSRGVARVYEMTFVDRVWRLERTEADFSPLDFSQRYVGELSDDGRTIAGRWEIAHDRSTWELDFHLTYTRTG
jgi:hypothetical protein